LPSPFDLTTKAIRHPSKSPSPKPSNPEPKGSPDDLVLKNFIDCLIKIIQPKIFGLKDMLLLDMLHNLQDSFDSENYQKLSYNALKICNNLLDMMASQKSPEISLANIRKEVKSITPFLTR
jgi:hypothetical protein